MADLISRKDAMDEVKITAYGFWHHEVIRKAYECLMRNIKALPAVDAVPVVRCKDCKNLRTDGAYIYCGRFHGMIVIRINDFCSYGERKTDA
jgi:hypothetical protein